MRRFLCLTVQVVLAIALVSFVAGCIYEGDGLDNPRVLMTNNTDLTLKVLYLSERRDVTPEGLERIRSVTILEPGEDWSTGFPGYDRHKDGCLDAAMVALGPDGTEVDRLPAGTCAPDPKGDIHWNISRN